MAAPANKEDAGLPLTALEAQTELAPAQYQFKHLSFQEGLFAQHLLIQAEAGWEGWETDEKAAEFLNNPFMNNTCRIAAGYAGHALSRRMAADVGLLGAGDTPRRRAAGALADLREEREAAKVLSLMHNGVGTKHEDSAGQPKQQQQTSTAISNLNLSNNNLGNLGTSIKAFGRGLSSNKTLTNLDVSNNNLLPDGIKVVCNALKSCTAMRDLNLSYRLAGARGRALEHAARAPHAAVGRRRREGATTRSERTFWLDTRGRCSSRAQTETARREQWRCSRRLAR